MSKAESFVTFPIQDDERCWYTAMLELGPDKLRELERWQAWLQTQPEDGLTELTLLAVPWRLVKDADPNEMDVEHDDCRWVVGKRYIQWCCRVWQARKFVSARSEAQEPDMWRLLITAYEGSDD